MWEKVAQSEPPLLRSPVLRAAIRPYCPASARASHLGRPRKRATVKHGGAGPGLGSGSGSTPVVRELRKPHPHAWTRPRTRYDHKTARRGHRLRKPEAQLNYRTWIAHTCGDRVRSDSGGTPPGHAPHRKPTAPDGLGNPPGRRALPGAGRPAGTEPEARIAAAAAPLRFPRPGPGVPGPRPHARGARRLTRMALSCSVTRLCFLRPNRLPMAARLAPRPRRRPSPRRAATVARPRPPRPGPAHYGGRPGPGAAERGSRPPAEGPRLEAWRGAAARPRGRGSRRSRRAAPAWSSRLNVPAPAPGGPLHCDCAVRNLARESLPCWLCPQNAAFSDVTSQGVRVSAEPPSGHPEGGRTPRLPHLALLPRPVGRLGGAQLLVSWREPPAGHRGYRAGRPAHLQTRLPPCSCLGGS